MAFAAAAPATTSTTKTNHIGHTCAWTVNNHLSEREFNALMNFCKTHPNLSGSIARKQLEIAVRQTSDETERDLKLVRREILDISSKGADAHPVLARVDKKYNLEQVLFSGNHSDIFLELTRRYRAARNTVHTTIVAGIIKRYVRDGLRGISLRDHGGVYFISEKLEGDLFDLREYLERTGTGHITRITVGGSADEENMITDEIRRITQKQIDGLREAFEETNLSDPKERRRMHKKVAKVRQKIAEMQDLFGFAKSALEENSKKARTFLKHVQRGERALPEDLFTSAEAASAEQDCSSSENDAQSLYSPP